VLIQDVYAKETIKRHNTPLWISL